MHGESKGRRTAPHAIGLLMDVAGWYEEVWCCFGRLLRVKPTCNARFFVKSVHMQDNRRDGHILNFGCNIRAMW